MFLLDTNIVSDLRKQRQPVVDWIIDRESSQLFISVITLGEIARGAEMKRRRDPVAGRALDNWLDRTRITFGDRVIEVTEEIAVEWGRLSALRTRGDADGLIAATAAINRLTLVTRNTADFADTGISLVNPWVDD